MRKIVQLLVAGASVLVLPRCCAAAGPSQTTVRAFDDYIAAAERRFQSRMNDPGKIPVADTLPENDRDKTYRDLKQGRIVILNQLAGKDAEVPGGLIHDWIAMAFIPGATLDSTLTILQDYDHDNIYYRPDVVKSKLLDHSGNQFHVLLRLKRTYVITAIFDTEYDVRYALVDRTHAYSNSISTRIAEVEDAGTPDEHKESPGEDRGLLWRLNSYWRFYEADGGTYIQCEAISLTRDIPTGLGWLVKPFVEKVPMESLRFTLTATRDAVLQHKLKGD